MNIEKLIGHTTNNIEMFKLPKKYAKEVSQLCEDITHNTNYKDLKIKVPDTNHAQVVGTNRNWSLEVNLDFKNWSQHQIEKGKTYFFSIGNSIREFVQEIRGPIGGEAKRARTSITYKNKNNGNINIKTEDYQNFVSGNEYRREETQNGVTFYKKINDIWVKLFDKK